MRERAGRYAGHRRKHQASKDEPLLVVVVDEIAFLTAYAGDNKLRDRANKALATLLTQGRAVGVCVVAAIQDPRKEVIGYRNLFPTKIALRLDERTQVDMVLGEGARAAGARCDQIPTPRQGLPTSRSTGFGSRGGCGPGSSPMTDIAAMAASYPAPAPGTPARRCGVTGCGCGRGWGPCLLGRQIRRVEPVGHGPKSQEISGGCRVPTEISSRALDAPVEPVTHRRPAGRTPRRFPVSALPPAEAVQEAALVAGVCIRPIVSRVTDIDTGERRTGADRLRVDPGGPVSAVRRPGPAAADAPVPGGLASHRGARTAHGRRRPRRRGRGLDEPCERGRRVRSTRRRDDAPELPRVPVEDRTVGRVFVASDGKRYRPSMFITHTLPSYGKVDDDGVPLDPETYDYRRAALDAIHFPKLIDRYWQNLRRCAGYEVQYFSVIELQRRGAPHMHAAVRGAHSRAGSSARSRPRPTSRCGGPPTTSRSTLIGCRCGRRGLRRSRHRRGVAHLGRALMRSTPIREASPPTSCGSAPRTTSRD